MTDEQHPTDEELRVLYPEVDEFAKRMRTELWANRGKGDHAGWQAMSIRTAWGEMAWHLGKLTGAIKNADSALALELAADIANGALMFDDIVRIQLGERSPVVPCEHDWPMEIASGDACMLGCGATRG